MAEALDESCVALDGVLWQILFVDNPSSTKATAAEGAPNTDKDCSTENDANKQDKLNLAESPNIVYAQVRRAIWSGERLISKPPVTSRLELNSGALATRPHATSSYKLRHPLVCNAVSNVCDGRVAVFAADILEDALGCPYLIVYELCQHSRLLKVLVEMPLGDSLAMRVTNGVRLSIADGPLVAYRSPGGDSIGFASPQPVHCMQSNLEPWMALQTQPSCNGHTSADQDELQSWNHVVAYPRASGATFAAVRTTSTSSAVLGGPCPLIFQEIPSEKVGGVENPSGMMMATVSRPCLHMIGRVLQRWCRTGESIDRVDCVHLCVASSTNHRASATATIAVSTSNSQHWLYEIRMNSSVMVTATRLPGEVISVYSACSATSDALIAVKCRQNPAFTKSDASLPSTETIILRRSETEAMLPGDTLAVAESCGGTVVGVFADDWRCSGSEQFLVFVDYSLAQVDNEDGQVKKKSSPCNDIVDKKKTLHAGSAAPRLLVSLVKRHFFTDGVCRFKSEKPLAKSKSEKEGIPRQGTVSVNNLETEKPPKALLELLKSRLDSSRAKLQAMKKEIDLSRHLIQHTENLGSKVSVQRATDDDCTLKLPVSVRAAFSRFTKGDTKAGRKKRKQSTETRKSNKKHKSTQKEVTSAKDKDALRQDDSAAKSLQIDNHQKTSKRAKSAIGSSDRNRVDHTFLVHSFEVHPVPSRGGGYTGRVHLVADIEAVRRVGEESDGVIFRRLKDIALTGICLNDHHMAISVSATSCQNLFNNESQCLRVEVHGEMEIGPYAEWKPGGQVDCLGYLSWKIPDVFCGGATSMIVGSQTLSISQIMQPCLPPRLRVPAAKDPGGKCPDLDQVSTISLEYTPRVSLLARSTQHLPPTSFLSSEVLSSVSLLSPYTRLQNTVRAALIATGADPEKALHVCQTSTGCRIDLMLQNMSSSSLNGLRPPCVHTTVSATSAAAVARASMSVLNASLPHGIELSKNWYTRLHLLALHECIDSCVNEVREMFGDSRDSDEEHNACKIEKAQGHNSEVCTDLSYSRLLRIFQ